VIVAEGFELLHALVPRSAGVPRWAWADEVSDIPGRVGAGLFDGSSDLVIEGSTETFESLDDRGVDGRVLVHEGESLHETVVVCLSACEFGSEVCSRGSGACPREWIALKIRTDQALLGAFDVECCTRERVDDLVSAQQ
jgi:hypothetical protein